MNTPCVEIGAGAAFLAALLFYCLQPEELLALLLAIMTHELGHLAAIRLLGQRLTGFRAELGGFCLDYSGQTPPWGHALIAAAGPATGLFWAFAASMLGGVTGCEWLYLSAGVSLLLSLFNLLPIAPLDGGRMISTLLEAALGPAQGENALRWISLVLSTLLFVGGIGLMLLGRGAALLLVGGCLGFSSLRGLGLVKAGKIR